MQLDGTDLILNFPLLHLLEYRASPPFPLVKDNFSLSWNLLQDHTFFGESICWHCPVNWVDFLFYFIFYHKGPIFAGYVKDFQVYDPHRVGKITVELQGRITDCRALMHRKDIKAKEIQEYTTRTLPTRQVSIHPSIHRWILFDLFHWSSAIYHNSV